MNSRDAELIAERAWNATKSDDDPPFAACQPEHRHKLSYLVTEIERIEADNAPPAGAQGLENYETEVRRLLVMPADPPKALLTDGDDKSPKAKSADKPKKK